MLSDLFVSACSRLRDNGEKAKEESEREARTGKKKTRGNWRENGTAFSTLFSTGATRAFPSSRAFYFRVRSLICPFPHYLRAWNRLHLCRRCVLIQSGSHTEFELEPEEGDELRLRVM